MLVHRGNKMKTSIWIIMITICSCTHYTLRQSLNDFSAVEGIGVGHGVEYVGVGDFNGVVKVYRRKGTQLSLHQTISDSTSAIWDVCMTDDHWMGVAYYNGPVTVYAFDNSTNLFKPIQYFHDLDAVYSIHMSWPRSVCVQ